MTLFMRNDPFTLEVRRLMARDPAQVGFATSLEETARHLLLSEADAVVVVRDDGSVAGLVSERELVFGAQAEAMGSALAAGDIASREFVFVLDDEPLGKALEAMAAREVQRAVVLDAADTAVGLLSLHAGSLGQLLSPVELDREAAAVV